MYRHLSRLVAISFSFLIVSQVIGQQTDAGPDYEHLKKLEWLIGDWEADWIVPKAKEGYPAPGNYPSGANVRSYCSYSWIENRNYIALTFRDEIDGKIVHQGFEIVGVDPKSKKIIHWLSSILGGWGTGEWSEEGKAWVLKWCGTTADQTTYEGVSYMVPVDVDTHTWEMKNNKRNGEASPDTPQITFRRVGNQTHTQAHQKWMDYFLGEWIYESSTGKTGELAFKYAPGKYAMLGMQPGSDASVQIVGWQPDRGVLVDTEYDKDGTYSVIEYSEIGDREMRGTFTHSSGPNGNFAGATVVITIEQDDLATAVIKAKGDNGEIVEVRNTFRRKSN